MSDSDQNAVDTEDSGMELSLEEIAVGGYSKLKTAVLFALSMVFLLIAILFWTGVISGGGQIPTDTLWRINMAMTLLVWAFLALKYAGMAVFSLGYGYLLMAKAIANGDWEWFLYEKGSDNNGPAMVFITLVIAFVAYLIVGRNYSVIGLPVYLFYGLIFVSLLFAGIRGGQLAFSWLSSVSAWVAHYRQEAAAGATFEKGLGYYLLVLAIASYIIGISLANLTGLTGSSSEVLVFSITGWFASPLGIWLDMRATGLYHPFKIRYVYILFTFLPVFGGFVVLYYLARRRWNAYQSDSVGGIEPQTTN